MTVMVHDFYDDEGNVMYSNTLVCAVATTGALGFPFDWLMLDEFEFWDLPEGIEYMYDQVLEPRTFHTKGQIIIYSNPNGKNFVSEKLHTRTIKKEYPVSVSAEEVLREYPKATVFAEYPTKVVYDTNELQFHVYNINFLDNPANSRAEWEMKKVHVHPIIFASTMAAERTESEGSALTERDIQKCIADKELTDMGLHAVVDKPSSFFLDLGFVSDQSVLVAGWVEHKRDADGRFIEGASEYRFVYKTYPQAYEIPALWGRIEGPEPSVPSLIKRYGQPDSMFELDITGKEGNEVLAQEMGLGCSGVKMSGPWKATWYERFISLAKQGRIRIALAENYIDGENKDFVHQARSLRISTKMPDGRSRPYPLYHHTSERDHDDIVDALVGCLSLLDEDMNPQAGGFLIPGAQPSIERDNRKLLKDIPEDSEIIGYDDGIISNDAGRDIFMADDGIAQHQSSDESWNW
jgi:hypothetical protein